MQQEDQTSGIINLEEESQVTNGWTHVLFVNNVMLYRSPVANIIDTIYY